jgi:hypothetical protein
MVLLLLLLGLLLFQRDHQAYSRRCRFFHHFRFHSVAMLTHHHHIHYIHYQYLG